MPTTISPARTVVEFRPGEGGDDARAFADELRDAFTAYLTRQGFTAERGDLGERTATLTSDAPPAALEWLAGTHRVQRIPRGSSARHTSTATVAVLEAPEQDRRPIEVGEVRVDRYRGHGPGGQHKNKVSTAVRMVHAETGIVVTRESGRSQSANLADAERDLAQRLTARQRRQAERDRQSRRRQQVVAERAAKTFTHNEQRGQVVDHATGRRWSAKRWARGLL